MLQGWLQGMGQGMAQWCPFLLFSRPDKPGVEGAPCAGCNLPPGPLGLRRQIPPYRSVTATAHGVPFSSMERAIYRLVLRCAAVECS